MSFFKHERERERESRFTEFQSAIQNVFTVLVPTNYKLYGIDFRFRQKC